MTRKQILTALRDNRRVVLAGDPWKWVRRDLFGDIVVVDIRHGDEPVRKATLSDMRRATVMGTTVPVSKKECVTIKTETIMKTVNELLREDIRRNLSGILTDTGAENKMECNVRICRKGAEAAACYLYMVPGGGTAVGMDYSGHTEERDFDGLAPGVQREIFDGLFTKVYGRTYEPVALMELRPNRKAEPLLVTGRHLLRGGDYPLITDTLATHLGDELTAYLKKADMEGLTCGGDFYLLTKNLATGEGGRFLGREYYFVPADGLADIDDLKRETDEI